MTPVITYPHQQTFRTDPHRAARGQPAPDAVRVLHTYLVNDPRGETLRDQALAAFLESRTAAYDALHQLAAAKALPVLQETEQGRPGARAALQAAKDAAADNGNDFVCARTWCESCRFAPVCDRTPVGA